jgi:hypothetical protein
MSQQPGSRRRVIPWLAAVVAVVGLVSMAHAYALGAFLMSVCPDGNTSLRCKQPLFYFWGGAGLVVLGVLVAIVALLRTWKRGDRRQEGRTRDFTERTEP